MVEQSIGQQFTFMGVSRDPLQPLYFSITELKVSPSLYKIGGGGILGCGVVGGSKITGTGRRGIPEGPGCGISAIPLVTDDDSIGSLLLAEVLPFE